MTILKDGSRAECSLTPCRPMTQTCNRTYVIPTLTNKKYLVAFFYGLNRHSEGVFRTPKEPNHHRIDSTVNAKRISETRSAKRVQKERYSIRLHEFIDYFGLIFDVFDSSDIGFGLINIRLVCCAHNSPRNSQSAISSNSFINSQNQQLKHPRRARKPSL
jgi:hypothetical protein